MRESLLWFAYFSFSLLFKLSSGFILSFVEERREKREGGGEMETGFISARERERILRLSLLPLSPYGRRALANSQGFRLKSIIFSRCSRRSWRWLFATCSHTFTSGGSAAATKQDLRTGGKMVEFLPPSGEKMGKNLYFIPRKQSCFVCTARGKV